MRGNLRSDFIEKLLFSAILIGMLLSAGAAYRYFALARQLDANMAARIHEEGGEVALESKAQAQGLFAADVARRRLLQEQSSMMVVGGLGLALLALGWLAYDMLRSRRRKSASSG